VAYVADRGRITHAAAISDIWPAIPPALPCPSAQREEKGLTLMLGLVIGFLRWIILGVLGNRWFELALVLALAAAAVTTVRQVRSRSMKILDTTTFAFFLFVFVGVIGFRWMITHAHSPLPL
jgi:hypothetical protein